MRSFLLIIPLLGICGSLLAQDAKDKKNDWEAEDLHGKVKSMTIRGFKASAGMQGSVLKGSLIHTTVKKYNDNGYLLESTSSIGGNKIGNYTMPFRSAKIVYKYDKYNNLLSSCSYNTQGQLEVNDYHWSKLISRHTYRYNDRGQCTMESEYEPDGRLKM